VFSVEGELIGISAANGDGVERERAAAGIGEGDLLRRAGGTLGLIEE
jgi:hypothetical protein